MVKRAEDSLPAVNAQHDALLTTTDLAIKAQIIYVV